MILTGDCLKQLKTLPDESVQTCITSPPYWGLRDYGVSGQLGLEKTPDEYVASMVQVFAQVRRVLKSDGTLWLNLGDSYCGHSVGNPNADSARQKRNNGSVAVAQQNRVPIGLKPKDLVGIPWRVAFALQQDGWYLRQDIIWHKPNPMPESVRDRCTKAHEYIFLLAKSERYLFDVDAIKEPSVSLRASGNKERKQRPSADSLGRGAQAGSIPWSPASWKGSSFHTGKTGEHQLGRSSVNRASGDVYTAKAYASPQSAPRGSKKDFGDFDMRQKRSVWTVTTKPFKGAHFATFPPDLIEPCVLAGSKLGDTVLDPFFGAGTTGLVAQKHGRKWIGIELNPEYVAIAQERLNVAQLKLEGA